MNWEILGNLADIAAAAAVVVSLIYLSIQIKQNTVSSNTSTAIAFSDASATISTVLAQDAELNKLFWAYLSGEELTQDDARRAHAIIILYINVMEQAFDLYTSGALSEEKWQGRLLQLKWFSGHPGFNRFWKVYGELQAPAWKAMIESTMNDV